jgi:uncharacterized protein
MTKPVQETHREFVIAAWNGMIDQIRDTLDYNPGAVKWVDPRSGVTALHYAAAQGHADVIRLLLGWGADVNARDDDGQTPLMFAAGHGGRDHLQPLLDAGADLDRRDERDRTAIDHADENSQPRNAGLIRAEAQRRAEEKQRQEALRLGAEAEGARAQMHEGAAKPVTVRKPLQLKI